MELIVLMNKEQFIKYMGIIHKRYDVLETLYDDLEKLTGVVSDRIINDTSIEPMVDMLAEWVGDTDGWLRWYVFEKEWGNRYELDAFDKDGSILPSTTYDDIWNLIQSSKGE